MVTGFFVIIFAFTIINSLRFSHSNGVKFDLIRRHDQERTAGLDGFRRLLRSDTIRLNGISEKIRLTKGRTVRRRTQEGENSNDTFFPACTNSTSRKTGHNVSAELEMHSAADDGAGQYLVKFRVGSPAQEVMLIADTGSELTWMKCRYKCRGARCGRDSRIRRVFRADHSSTFRPVPCSSSACKIDLSNLFSLSRCASPADPCAYDYRYADGSASLGVFGNETITFSLTNGRKTRLHNALVGCSESSSGSTIHAGNGVMGLGYSNYSFALRAANIFGGKFSYCLVDHLSPKNKSSYLIFGSHKQVSNISLISKMRYTQLVLGLIDPFYAVNIKGISIGGVMLDIPAGTWNLSGEGGAIVDSGSSLMGLTRPAYVPVMARLRKSLVNFENMNLDIGPVEYCFNSTGFRESLVPRLAIHFADGARFNPPVKSYVIDAAPGVKCLGFVPLAWPGACVIGNIMQQNHFWEFDLANARLGFAASSCA
ncbi:hypothetical protein CASFOL_028535 [Castilleja foliolosa]|uniref:Peptidase A1 domain-containing protein n=1 Tax=Castilleja foliolosa TaxID=1961234 RepID=A0ABD3CC89_9LAMI